MRQSRSRVRGVRLTRGSRLGPYEVLSTLGTGGMAEVYRARDTRLGRDVALKVINEALTGDPELLERFEQEARLAGSLNHPNLVAVYDVGLHEGSPYFITELLQGEPLRQRLARGRVPLDSALDWSSQLAEGLAAVHARGIVHRDVKPENVFVSSDGHVKLLDFGIAKLVEGSRPEGGHGLLEDTVTPTGHGRTQTGAIVGTPAYMSPEQVRGERVDARTDVFSLGAVMHEMLSGDRPFSGASMVEKAHAVLHDDPAPLPNVPPLVAQVVRRCLAKEPDNRFQSARDLAFALEMLRSDVGPKSRSSPETRPSLVRRRWWVPAVIAALAAGAFLVITRLQPVRAPPPPMTVERVTGRLAFVRAARFTPEGRVVFNAASSGRPVELFERNFAAASVQSLPLQNMLLAAVSPKGELAVLLPPKSRPLIGFEVHGTLARVAAGGGTPREVLEDVQTADWSPSGDLAVVRGVEEAQSLEFPIGTSIFKTAPRAWIGNVRVSPRGDLIAFIHHPISGQLTGEAIVLDLQGKRRQVSRLWRRVEGLAWSPRNEVWFTAGEYLPNQLQALPMVGPERTIYNGLSPIVLHDIAPDGSVLLGQVLGWQEVVFLDEGVASQRSLSWGDRSGGGPLSADGRLLLVDASGPNGEHLVLARETSGTPPQILGEGFAQDLSRDGRWVLAESSDGKALTILPTGPGAPRNVPLNGLELGSARWLDGTNRALLVARGGSDRGHRLYSIDLGGSGAIPLSEPGLFPWALAVSPDQGWAATIDATQRPMLHPLSGGKSVVLTDLKPGSVPARWASKDELWFARVEQATPGVIRLARFDIRRGRTVEERAVSPTIDVGGGSIDGVQVTPDGKRIAFNQGRIVGYLYIVRGMAVAGR
jgi:eukaryotic-like serine/threonine-protein kinase